MITKILLPIDGSQTSLKSAEYAAWFAGMLNAMKGTPSISRRAADRDARKENDAPTTVILLHVINEKIFSSISAPVEGGMTHTLEPIEAFLKKEGDRYMAQIESMLKDQGIQVLKSVRRGDPADEIIREAENSGADLIIIGSHGRTSSRAALLGSVAYGVIHNAKKIPVLVVRKD
jgi:nucleotide-binding universal stress UspA family protein